MSEIFRIDRISNKPGYNRGVILSRIEGVLWECEFYYSGCESYIFQNGAIVGFPEGLQVATNLDINGESFNIINSIFTKGILSEKISLYDMEDLVFLVEVCDIGAIVEGRHEYYRRIGNLTGRVHCKGLFSKQKNVDS